jgi:hypothetical protein
MTIVFSPFVEKISPHRLVGGGIDWGENGKAVVADALGIFVGDRPAAGGDGIGGRGGLWVACG